MSVIKKTTGRGFLYARTVNVAQAEVSHRVRHGWLLIPRATIINPEAFLDALEMRRDFFRGPAIAAQRAFVCHIAG